MTDISLFCRPFRKQSSRKVRQINLGDESTVRPSTGSLSPYLVRKLCHRHRHGSAQRWGNVIGQHFCCSDVAAVMTLLMHTLCVGLPLAAYFKPTMSW